MLLSGCDQCVWAIIYEYFFQLKLEAESDFMIINNNQYNTSANSYHIIIQNVISGLMRCRLSPDDRKLVISTTGGYLILINDLDLNTLARDLAGFRVS